jgi:hypothetical protein
VNKAPRWSSHVHSRVEKGGKRRQREGGKGGGGQMDGDSGTEGGKGALLFDQTESSGSAMRMASGSCQGRAARQTTQCMCRSRPRYSLTMPTRCAANAVHAVCTCLRGPHTSGFAATRKSHSKQLSLGNNMQCHASHTRKSSCATSQRTITCVIHARG